MTVSSTGTLGGVSLVVCVYLEARLPLLRDLLLSVDAGTRVPDQTIVVVDRNHHLETLLRREFEGRPIEIVSSPAGGLSAARNVGWKAATSEWVAFVDDDALVATDWLSALAGTAAGGGGDIVGGRIDPIWAGGRAPTWYTERIGWIVGCSFRGLPRKPARVRSVIGCNMLIRRRLLDRLGGFSEGLGREGGSLIGSEETEFCIRAGLDGTTVLYVPGSLAWQVVPRSRQRLGYAWRRAWGEGRSKARIASLHGPVLDVEATYAGELLSEAADRFAGGATRRDRAELTRASMLMTVLATTGLAYALERARSAVAMVGHAVGSGKSVSGVPSRVSSEPRATR